MNSLLNDFARLASLTFGDRPCYFAAWKQGRRLLDAGYGFSDLEIIRKPVEALWTESTTAGEKNYHFGDLELQKLRISLYPKYQYWTFQMPEHQLAGILVFFDKQETHFQPIGQVQIQPWLNFLKSTIECYLSKITESESAVFKAVLDNSSEMIVLIDENHKVIEFNQYAHDLLIEFFGIHIQKGEDYLNFVLPQIMETYLTGFQTAMQGRRFVKELNLGSSVQSYWFEFNIFPVYNLSSELIGVCLKGTDITAEKRTNLELASLAETFNALINNLNESVVILTKDRKILRFNSYAKERLAMNVEKEIVLGADFLDFLYEGGEEVFLKNFNKALNGELIDSEGVFLSRKGEKIWINTRYIPIYQGNEALLGVALLAKNIHEQKMLQLALQESEEKFRKMVTSAAMAILITDQMMTITTVNPEVSRIFGYSEQELIGQSIQLLIPPRYHQVYSRHQSRYAQSPVPMRMMEDRNTKALRKNGDEIDVEVSLNSFTLGDKTFFMAMILDVTERNRLDKLLTNASELSLTGNWEYNTYESGEESLYWSPMTKKIFEVPENFVPKFENLSDFIEEGSYRVLEKNLNQLMQTGQGYDLELMANTLTGKQKWVRAIGTMERIGGSGVKIYGSIQDITEKKLNEIELIQSLQSVKNYKEAIDKSNYVLVTGLDGNVIDVNDRWCELTEYSREELIGASSNITKSDFHPQAFFDELWATIRSGKIWKGEIKDISKNGNYFWVDTTIVPLKNEKGEVYQFLTIRNDITEKKKAMEELEVRAKELVRSNAELEQFAYVASHDLQEPLRMVTSFLTLLKRKHSSNLDESANKYIDFAVDGALRMRTTILDLLEFSRVGKGGEEKQEVKIDQIIDEIKILQKKSIEESRADFECENLPIVYSYKAQLLQVFGNLISNAIKYRKPHQAPLVKINAVDKGDHWLFSVSDNGIGFSMEYAEKIFVIFQRLQTRDSFQGNGIGLAIVRKVLENLKGKIWVKSAENEGSTFYFTLPK